MVDVKPFEKVFSIVDFIDLLVILVHESVVENRIPVVLVEGTGGCCDLFAKCSQLYHEYHSKMKPSDGKSFTKDEEEQMKIKLREKFQLIDEKINSTSRLNVSDETDPIDYFELIYECLTTRHRFLNFIDLKPHNHLETDLDLAILQALLNSIDTNEMNESILCIIVTIQNDLSEMTIDQKREQIHLAFEWKRIDLMKNFIMKDDYDWKVRRDSHRFIQVNDLSGRQWN